MESSAADLVTPSMLVATPQVQDPYFDHSVVLLLHHDAEGSFGFNINRPTELAVEEVLSGLEIPWHGDPGSFAFLGGPVQPQLGSVLFGSDPAELAKVGALETAAEVSPGLRLTQHVDDLAALAKHPPAGFRLLLGYAGWAAGQLVQEILRNDWIVTPVLDRLVFSGEPETVWRQALEAAGVDPQTLPTWTPDQSDMDAN